MHLPLQFALRDAVNHEVALFDLPRPYFFVAPPSGFLLVSAKVDSCLVLMASIVSIVGFMSSSKFYVLYDPWRSSSGVIASLL